jgi:Ni/Fe-hydrogenase 1 B-type cytochrome subunit
MAAITIKRVKVWSGLLRVSHWLMAFAVLILLGTGWLLGSVPQAYEALLDYHYLAGYALIAGLLLRAWLLFFGRATDRLADLVPRRRQFSAMLDMLRFYLSFGRWPLPAWYAHNPLWQPVYLLLLMLLAVQVLTGVFAYAPYLLAGRAPVEWHASGAVILGAITALHLLAVFLHDLKGTGSDNSAMINGHRIFIVNPLQQPVDPGVQQVSLDQIGKPGRKRDDS